MRVTTGVTACGQRRPVCNTLPEVGNVRTMERSRPLSNLVAPGGYQDALKDTPDQNSKGRLKRNQQQRWTGATTTVEQKNWLSSRRVKK
ncbi:hypothetical protein ElyMa_005646200 [Elysia marginata]|uniref:Uncharacterized protein n=1 Tax=Elysia marginata TaxID=1093978 RepID=A0AAV4FBB6_9GAST|nr:hypothetical protein ElyMa_005646200 [Elysia marginata]